MSISMANNNKKKEFLYKNMSQSNSLPFFAVKINRCGPQYLLFFIVSRFWYKKVSFLQWFSMENVRFIIKIYHLLMLWEQKKVPKLNPFPHTHAPFSIKQTRLYLSVSDLFFEWKSNTNATEYKTVENKHLFCIIERKIYQRRSHSIIIITTIFVCLN